MAAVSSVAEVRRAIVAARAEIRRRSGILQPIVGVPVVYGRLAEPEEFELMVRVSGVITGG